MPFLCIKFGQVRGCHFIFTKSKVLSFHGRINKCYLPVFLILYFQVQYVEKKIQAADGEKEEPSKIICDQFTFEKLHDQMAANNNEAIGIYDELTSIYEQIDNNKGASMQDRKTLLTLNGGGPWTRATKTGGIQSMDTTCFNFCGFIQPIYVVAMLSLQDPDGFNDRQLLLCPQEKEVDFEDLTGSISSAIPDFGNILYAIRVLHCRDRKHEYAFSEEAREVFKAQYNAMRRKKSDTQDEDRRGIYAKARGQTARLALIVHVLSEAFEYSRDHDDLEYFDIPREISARDMERACAIMQLLLEHKLALMPPEVKFTDVPVEEVTVLDPESQKENQVTFTAEDVMKSKVHNLKSLLAAGIDEIDASTVSGRHLMPAVANGKSKYSAAAAKSWMTAVADIGFGSVMKTKRNSLVFRKRNYDELDDDLKQKLHTIGLSVQDYKRRKE